LFDFKWFSAQYSQTTNSVRDYAKFGVQKYNFFLFLQNVFLRRFYRTKSQEPKIKILNKSTAFNFLIIKLFYIFRKKVLILGS